MSKPIIHEDSKLYRDIVRMEELKSFWAERECKKAGSFAEDLDVTIYSFSFTLGKLERGHIFAWADIQIKPKTEKVGYRLRHYGTGTVTVEGECFSVVAAVKECRQRFAKLKEALENAQGEVR